MSDVDDVTVADGDVPVAVDAEEREAFAQRMLAQAREEGVSLVGARFVRSAR